MRLRASENSTEGVNAILHFRGRSVDQFPDICLDLPTALRAQVEPSWGTNSIRTAVLHFTRSAILAAIWHVAPVSAAKSACCNCGFRQEHSI